MEKTKENIWISAHLFYEEDSNRLLTGFIKPFIENMRLENSLQNYFFIRFCESGPHIRLRLLVAKEQEKKWREKLEQESTHFFCIHPSKSERGPNLNWELFPDNSIQYILYKPEIERYGDINTIKNAELQFEACSDAVLQFLTLHSNDWNKNAELILALKMHLTFFAAMDFSLTNMMDVCKSFIRLWLPYLFDPAKPIKDEQQFFVSKFKDRFKLYQDKLVPAISDYLYEHKTGKLHDEILKPYYTRNQQIKAAYKACNYDLLINRDITNSFIHMTHNRIGIINSDEAYIIYLLYKCLENILADE